MMRAKEFLRAENKKKVKIKLFGRKFEFFFLFFFCTRKIDVILFLESLEVIHSIFRFILQSLTVNEFSCNKIADFIELQIFI